MSDAQKALVDLSPGERTWFGSHRATRLQSGKWSFWSKSSQCVTIAHDLPQAVHLAEMAMAGKLETRYVQSIQL